MSVFNVKARAAQGSETPPAGSHPAVLVALVDLGVHEKEYKGNVTYPRQVMLAWELTTEKVAGSTRNHVVANRYTLSLSTKAALRELIREWRGKDLADGEDFDLLRMLGKACLLSIVHEVKGDRTYARIGGATAPPRGLSVPPATRKPFAWEQGGEDPYPDPDWVPWLYGRPVGELVKEGWANMQRHEKAGPDNGQVIVDEAGTEEIPF